MIEKMKSAGSKLANIAFNLAQNDRIPDDIRAICKAQCTEWDAALAATAPTVAVDEPTFLDIMGMVRAQMHRVYASAIDREDIDSKHMAEIEAAIRALAVRAKLSAGVAIPEGWQKLERAGQIKKGDKLRFVCAGRKFTKTAKLILNAGTDKEEIVYNKRQNFYFITGMAIAGTSSHKDVEVLAAAPSPDQQGEK